jgi:hypothetical protein
MFDDVGYIQDGPIVGWDFCIGRERKMPPSAAACPGFAEITDVAVYGEDHVTGIVGENCIVLGGDVIQELFRMLECVNSGFGGM